MNKYDRELTMDLPIEYKGLSLHPIKLRDSMDFLLCSEILKIRKNDMNAKFISMTYLDFIKTVLTEKGDMAKIYQGMLYRIFQLSLRHDSISISYGLDEKGKSYLSINDVVLKYKDFDEVRNIILFQNILNYKDYSKVDSTLYKSILETERLKSKGDKSVSLEKQISFMVSETSMRIDEIFDLPIRRFSTILEMIDKKIGYIIHKTASLSGMVKFDKEIKHFFTETEISQFENTVEFNSLVDKFK